MIYIVIKSLDKSSENLLDEKQRKKFYWIILYNLWKNI
jgi:hypothetical protein